MAKVSTLNMRLVRSNSGTIYDTYPVRYELAWSSLNIGCNQRSLWSASEIDRETEPEAQEEPYDKGQENLFAASA